MALILGLSARMACMSAPRSASILLLVPRSDLPLGIRPSKPSLRYLRLQLARVEGLSLTLVPSGSPTGSALTLLKYSAMLASG